jgi:hypothetical protein
MGRVTQVAMEGGNGFPNWVNVAAPVEKEEVACGSIAP